MYITVALIFPITICGQMPMTNISAVAGNTINRSRHVRSAHRRPFFIQRPVEHALDHRQQENRRDQQPDDGQRRRPRRQREHALENQEFADKSVQPRQPQRRENRNAHQPAKNRRDLAQPAKIINPAQPAAALLQKADEAKQDRRGQSVVEHLQQHAVERRGAFVPAWSLPVNLATANTPSRQ